MSISMEQQDMFNIQMQTTNRPTILMVGLFYGNVHLAPPSPIKPYYLTGKVKLEKEFVTPEYISGTVTIQQNSITGDVSQEDPVRPGITLINSFEGKVRLVNFPINIKTEAITGTVSIKDEVFEEDSLLNIDFTIPTQTDNDKPEPNQPGNPEYISKKYGYSELYGHGKLLKSDFLDEDLDISGNVKLTYTRLYRNILDGKLSILKQYISEDAIIGTVKIKDEEFEQELIDIDLFVPKYNVDVYIDTRVIVPKFRVQYTFPVDLQVVYGSHASFPVDIDVVNECIWFLDGTVELPKIDVEDGIECTVTLLPETYDDLECTVSLNRLATYRQFDGIGFLIGKVIDEFDVDITTEAYEDPIYDFSEDVMDCVVHFGGKSLFDFDITVKAEAIPKYDFEEDILKGLVYLRDYKRIGIVVDPRWNYDPYVFKSSLLTLFDKYYGKTVLDIVYGGHPRSDWDIEHLGYVFHNKLTKVPIIFDPIHPDHTKRTIEHYIYHLSDTPPETPLAKVFLFTDRPDYIASNPLSLITQFCKDNDIDFAIITSSGEFIDYHDNQAFSTTTNPLRTEPHSVLGPLSVMPMDTFNRVAEPSDPKHPYYHPTKIIY